MVIGITGGIGSGKSSILKLLMEYYQADVIEMDKIGNLVMSPGQNCYHQIVEAFGTGILNDDKSIDRDRLAEIVFADKSKLKLLNSFVHPAVREYVDTKVVENRTYHADKLLVLESAILFEADYASECDTTWMVYADDDVRTARIMKSRGYSIEKIQSIMNNQMTHEQLEKLTDYKIDNSNSLEDTLMQIENILGYKNSR